MAIETSCPCEQKSNKFCQEKTFGNFCLFSDDDCRDIIFKEPVENLVGTVYLFALYKSFEISAELNLFARHFALVENRSKLYYLFSWSFSDVNNLFSSTGRSLNRSL